MGGSRLRNQSKSILKDHLQPVSDRINGACAVLDNVPYSAARQLSVYFQALYNKLYDNNSTHPTPAGMATLAGSAGLLFVSELFGHLRAAQKQREGSTPYLFERMAAGVDDELDFERVFCRLSPRQSPIVFNEDWLRQQPAIIESWLIFQWGYFGDRAPACACIRQHLYQQGLKNIDLSKRYARILEKLKDQFRAERAQHIVDQATLELHTEGKSLFDDNDVVEQRVKSFEASIADTQSGDYIGDFDCWLTHQARKHLKQFQAEQRLFLQARCDELFGEGEYAVCFEGAPEEGHHIKLPGTHTRFDTTLPISFGEIKLKKLKPVQVADTPADKPLWRQVADAGTESLSAAWDFMNNQSMFFWIGWMTAFVLVGAAATAGAPITLTLGAATLLLATPLFAGQLINIGYTFYQRRKNPEKIAENEKRAAKKTLKQKELSANKHVLQAVYFADAVRAREKQAFDDAFNNRLDEKNVAETMVAVEDTNHVHAWAEESVKRLQKSRNRRVIIAGLEGLMTGIIAVFMGTWPPLAVLGVLFATVAAASGPIGLGVIGVGVVIGVGIGCYRGYQAYKQYQADCQDIDKHAKDLSDIAEAEKNNTALRAALLKLQRDMNCQAPLPVLKGERFYRKLEAAPTAGGEMWTLVKKIAARAYAFISSLWTGSLLNRAIFCGAMFSGVTLALPIAICATPFLIIGASLGVVWGVFKAYAYHQNHQDARDRTFVQEAGMYVRELKEENAELQRRIEQLTRLQASQKGQQKGEIVAAAAQPLAPDLDSQVQPQPELVVSNKIVSKKIGANLPFFDPSPATLRVSTSPTGGEVIKLAAKGACAYSKTSRMP